MSQFGHQNGRRKHLYPSSFRHIWEFTDNCKVSFAQRCLQDNIPRERRARNRSSCPAPCWQGTTRSQMKTTWKCSAVENHGFLCPVWNLACWWKATAAITQFSSLLHYLKKRKFCNHQADHLNLKSMPPHTEVMEGSRSAALFMATHNLWVQLNWRTKLVIDLIRWWALNLTATIRIYFVLDFLWKLQRWVHLTWRGSVASSVK